MSWITARRRRPVAGYAVVLLGLLLIGAIYATITGSGAPASAAAPSAAQKAQIGRGYQVFQANCQSCHGFAAAGGGVPITRCGTAASLSAGSAGSRPPAVRPPGPSFGPA